MQKIAEQIADRVLVKLAASDEYAESLRRSPGSGVGLAALLGGGAGAGVGLAGAIRRPELLRSLKGLGTPGRAAAAGLMGAGIGAGAGAGLRALYNQGQNQTADDIDEALEYAKTLEGYQG